jgi:hypothetical protein
MLVQVFLSTCGESCIICTDKYYQGKAGRISRLHAWALHTGLCHKEHHRPGESGNRKGTATVSLLTWFCKQSAAPGNAVSLGKQGIPSSVQALYSLEGTWVASFCENSSLSEYIFCVNLSIFTSTLL